MLCAGHQDEMGLEELFEELDHALLCSSSSCNLFARSNHTKAKRKVHWCGEVRQVTFKIDMPPIEIRLIRPIGVPLLQSDATLNLNDPLYRLRFFQQGRLLPFVTKEVS